MKTNSFLQLICAIAVTICLGQKAWSKNSGEKPARETASVKTLKCTGHSDKFFGESADLEMTIELKNSHPPVMDVDMTIKKMHAEARNLAGDTSKHPTTVVFGEGANDNLSAKNCDFTVELKKAGMNSGKVNARCDQQYAPLHFKCN